MTNLQTVPLILCGLLLLGAIVSDGGMVFDGGTLSIDVPDETLEVDMTFSDPACTMLYCCMAYATVRCDRYVRPMYQWDEKMQEMKMLKPFDEMVPDFASCLADIVNPCLKGEHK